MVDADDISRLVRFQVGRRDINKHGLVGKVCHIGIHVNALIYGTLLLATGKIAQMRGCPAIHGGKSFRSTLLIIGSHIDFRFPAGNGLPLFIREYEGVVCAVPAF